MTAVSHYLDSMGGVMLLALPVWLLVRTLYLTFFRQTTRWQRELGLALLMLYLIGLASQTLTLPPAPRSDLQALIARATQRWETGFGINLTPGYTIRSMLERGSYGQKVINLAGNVVMFLPLGLLPPLLWRKLRHLWATVGLSAAVSCLIEFLQLFLERAVDVDDVILNTLGGLLGYLLFCFLPKTWKNR